MPRGQFLTALSQRHSSFPSKQNLKNLWYRNLFVADKDEDIQTYLIEQNLRIGQDRQL